MNVIDSQVRSLRKRQLIDGFKAGIRDGAAWGIWTNLDEYGVGDALPAPHAQTLVLARTKTRLKGLSATRQERLINWGYAVCDAAVRAHVDDSLPPPPGFPYPRAGIG